MFWGSCSSTLSGVVSIVSGEARNLEYLGTRKTRIPRLTALDDIGGQPLGGDPQARAAN